MSEESGSLNPIKPVGEKTSGIIDGSRVITTVHSLAEFVRDVSVELVDLDPSVVLVENRTR
ncbi:hypothetical protein [Haloarcula sp. CGMCC 1.2071]|uniref:hypothetical protein n=1 Tax=Haloarcula sp. CGMCC 1.2071 TaxID=3111454 RepID=UPI00300EFAD5